MGRAEGFTVSGGGLSSRRVEIADIGVIGLAVMDENLVLGRAASETPDAPAIVGSGQRLPYGELVDRVAALAGGLKTRTASTRSGGPNVSRSSKR